MRFDVFTLFPEVFNAYFFVSIMQKAISNHIITIELHHIRDWASNRHRTTDDTPFGGGGGMVMKPEPIFSAVEAVCSRPPVCPVILMSPQGQLLTHALTRQLGTHERLAIICGRYEGVDERVREHLVDQEISIGDYVLSGGELPAMVLMEALTRQLPGALGDPDGALDDSFASGLLEYPHYTRPANFRGWQVPDVLLSGDHQRIARWRRKQSLFRTLDRRPDLLHELELNAQDQDLLNEIKQENPLIIAPKPQKRGEK